MIPAPARLRGRKVISRTVRSGFSTRGDYLIIHFLPTQDESSVGVCPQVAFAVGKAVGGSVVRHRITRQLRSCLRERLGLLPAGSTLVVRARSTAVGRTQLEFGRELDRLLPRVVGRQSRRSTVGSSR